MRQIILSTALPISCAMSCILYQTETGILLDIPKSIAEGSGVQVISAVGGRLEPYPSTEPKPSKRVRLLASIPVDEQIYYRKLETLITKELTAVRDGMGQRKWCLDREDAVMASTDYLPTEGRSPDSRITTKPPLILSACENQLSSMDCLENTIVFNPSNEAVKLNIAAGRYFRIPPHCTFLLASIEHSIHSFQTSPTLLSRCPGISAGKFDFILLDPPWSNRSVKHAKVYHTFEYQQAEHPFHYALHIVDQHLSQSGITAIWITNKRAIRTLVMRALHNLGFELLEELIWLKTTVYGEPLTPLDGLWRKPYEILLLLRRDKAACHSLSPLLEYPDVKRRVLIAVPDAHSRKPCLKEPLKPLLPDGYRALEIFARNLTAGWWSWGDEVLKFNEEVRTEAGGATA